jgi:hypothetical protein
LRIPIEPARAFRNAELLSPMVEMIFGAKALISRSLDRSQFVNSVQLGAIFAANGLSVRVILAKMDDRTNICSLEKYRKSK